MDSLKIVSKKFIGQKSVIATLSNEEQMQVSLGENQLGKIFFTTTIGDFVFNNDDVPSKYLDAYHILSGLLLDCWFMYLKKIKYHSFNSKDEIFAELLNGDKVSIIREFVNGGCFFIISYRGYIFNSLNHVNKSVRDVAVMLYTLLLLE